MTGANRFLVCHKGRRDGYKVAEALQEHNALEALLTDIFVPEDWIKPYWPSYAVDKARKRSSPIIPESKIKNSYFLAIIEACLGRVGFRGKAAFELTDPLYGVRLAKLSRSSAANVICYSSYAPKAFSSPFLRDRQKILFQYHPHHKLESEILAHDKSIGSGTGISFSKAFETEVVEAGTNRAKADDAWMLSDAVICASSFTKKSLEYSGLRDRPVLVVPYGIETIPDSRNSREGTTTKFLFVGTGMQRKGLHTLLLAWARLSSMREVSLTIVSRVVDPGIMPLVHQEGVSLILGADDRRLQELYSTHDAFIMPSLVEGFGQVYLEALSHGLPVIGTQNTCLPDIGDEEDGVFLCEAGSVESVRSRIEFLDDYIRCNPGFRLAARNTAQRTGWEHFKSKIVEFISD